MFEEAEGRVSTQPVQNGLFGPPPKPVRVIPRPKQTITERFWAFDKENPFIYRRIVQLARKAKMRGLDHYSMQGIFGILRWEIAVRTKRTDQFRLNDQFTSHYARLVNDREIDLRGFFELRKLRSKK